MKLKDILIGIFIIFIWGINFVAIAWALEDLPPLLLGGVRFLLIAALGSFFIKRPNIPWKWLALYALPISLGQFTFVFLAMANGMPAGLASLVLQSQALFTLIFSALLLKEKIKPLQLISMTVAGFGLYVIGSTQENTTMTGIGFGLSIAAAMSWALGNIVNRTLNQRGYNAGAGLVIWSAWIPPIPFFVMSVYFEGTEVIANSLLNMQITTIAALFYLALVASITGYTLWSYLLRHYPAAQVAPLSLGVPVVGLSAAAYFLNEAVSWQQGLGIILVLLGLLIGTLGEKLIAIMSKRATLESAE